jgi:hypothetical protein
MKILIWIFLLTGCAGTGLLSAITDTPSIEVDTTLGDKQEQVVGQVGHVVQGNIYQEIPMEFMLLMILGWLLPSPNEIWQGFLRLIKRD